MSTYVIGDIHACLPSLHDLLAQCDFQPKRDRLWQVGDLVNRGPQSAQTIRFMRDLDESAITLLGNHDLALLVLAAGVDIKIKSRDTSFTVLDEPDAEELINWLRHRPLFHVENNFAMVHAGLLPSWTMAQAQSLAAEVETALRGKDWKILLHHLFGNHPAHWEESLQGWDRLRVIVNAMTRLRFATPDGHMDMKPNGPPEQAPPGLLPWYELPDAAWRGQHTILCGHWSALGYRDMTQIVGLDSGCVWGDQLTAFRLEDRHVFQVNCPSYAETTSWD